VALWNEKRAKVEPIRDLTLFEMDPLPVILVSLWSEAEALFPNSATHFLGEKLSRPSDILGLLSHGRQNYLELVP
jgi:hypothetical protein